MSADDHHLGDDLQDALDGRLAPERRARVEEHLAACDQCRSEVDAWRQMQRAVRAMPRVALPPELEGQVRVALDRAHDRPARATSRRWFTWAAATLLVAIAAAWFTFARRDPVGAAFAHFAQYGDRSFTLDRVTSQPPVLEQYFAARRVGFPTRVFDFAMMNYTLAGGSVSDLAGAPSALFVYRDAGDHLVLCEMYEGRADAARSHASEVRQRPDGVTFYVVVREGGTAVFWQEGEIACVLVSDVGREPTIQLAFAKAMKV